MLKCTGNLKDFFFEGKKHYNGLVDRAGSMVEQKMQPPKAPSKKKAPKF